MLRFLGTFGEDRSALTNENFFLCGGLFDAPAELLAIVTPLSGFAARRLANVTMGLLILIGAWRIARLLGGPRAGLWTVLFLAATPTWYGHSFINAKDIPFAAEYIWSLYGILLVARSLPEIRWKTAVGSGFALALAVGIRVGGAVVIAYLMMVLAGWLLHARRTGLGLGDWKRGILAKLLLSFAIAYVLTAAFWPTVLLHPFSGLRGPLRAGVRSDICPDPDIFPAHTDRRRSSMSERRPTSHRGKRVVLPGNAAGTAPGPPRELP